jgi:mono/diheme cytochrome c family protein
MISHVSRYRLILLLIVVLAPLNCGISAADEDDVHPGLHCVVSDGHHSVTRIDRRLNFDWTDSQIENRLANGDSLTWSGNLLVRSGGRHTFHAQVTGSVNVVVDDEPVLVAEGENVFASGQSADLTAGDHKIHIEFQTSLTQPDKKPLQGFKLQLFWSSPEFTLESIPADALSHVADIDIQKAQHGRKLIDALRCAACHTGLGELPILKAPDLRRLRGNTDDADIIRRLKTPESIGNWSSMPVFEFSESEAKDVAAFLIGTSTVNEIDTAETPVWKEGDIDAGQKLLLTTGCLACHAMAQLSAGFEPQATPYHGPDLSNVVERRNTAWLTTWLKSPETINPEHRMPKFKLSEDEQRQVVAALTQQADAGRTAVNLSDIDSPDAAAIERGRALVVKSNCASCHRIEGLETPEASRSRPIANLKNTSNHSCVSAGPPIADNAAEKLPGFRLNDIQRDQIHSWLTTLNNNLSATTEFARGEFLLQRNGCLACHDRDQQTGLSALASTIEAKRDDLRGQSQALIPPPLTAVGDRLHDEYLQRAVAGEQKEPRLPWLMVRMPQFDLCSEDREGLVRYFVGSDRIPETADIARRELFSQLDPQHPAIATASELLIGNQLVGAGGFNCIACHTAGSFQPQNVAMGTRGSDIMTMGQRVRSRYFLRWMQNPIRVVPGIEMPAIRKPVSGVLHESLDEQVAVLWKALADPKFSPPTVVSRYEQLVTLSPGDRPCVIRDVFTIGNRKDHNNAARAFAVGFNNGHNLLLDLDTMQLRQWTMGEFARQRTEGKSWFWDMAGVQLLQTNGDIAFVRLIKNDSSASPLNPVIDELRRAELLSYDIDAKEVSLHVRFYFDPRKADGESERILPTHSSITAWNDPARTLTKVVLKFVLKPIKTEIEHSGWMWNVIVEDCPDDSTLQLSGVTARKSSDEIPWTVSLLSADQTSELPNNPRLRKGDAVNIRYQCGITPTLLPPPPVVKLQSTADLITSVPGFPGQRLPVGTAIMPTGMTWLADGHMAMISLKGDVWILSDTDGDDLQDSMSLFATGLSAPFGVQADGDAILVAHKPEVLRLRDSDGDGRADQFDVVASGWGLSDDYHDWTTGLVRNRDGDLFVGLGSDYSQSKRPADNDRWRGAVLKIDSTGTVSPIGTAFRFPMGLAFDRNQNLFATDNQGVQNTFNEINHVVLRKHYGVPSRHEETTAEPPEIPAIMVPHPWTRSVNSILFLPDNFANPDLAGHGIGCEYDTRCLIRFTVQEVAGVLQGACYRLSYPDQPGGGGNFVGPIASAVGPDGALYVGSVWDSGWQGGANTGSIERLTPDTSMPNGIREIRATSAGFQVTFFQPFKEESLMSAASTWSIQGYTRHWSGSYATPDSERYTLTPTAITLSDDRKTATLHVQPLKAGFLYEIGVNKSVENQESLWPTEGFYSMKAVP